MEKTDVVIIAWSLNSFLLKFVEQTYLKIY